MNNVKRAIIMAAGVGSRLRPVSLTVPKPLIRVNGKRMIETILDALLYNGINEIYIVVGYLKENFDALLTDYPSIHLIENPYYMECNNISSLYCARDYLEECIILDGDQVICNKEILSSRIDKSGYYALWTDKPTKEWLMQVEDNKVKSCSRTGGDNGWQLFSVSKWTREDGAKLRKYVEYEFVEKHNTDLYWDDVVMFCHFDKFDLGIYPIQETDLLEIDSYEELKKIDSSYF